MLTIFNQMYRLVLSHHLPLLMDATIPWVQGNVGSHRNPTATPKVSICFLAVRKANLYQLEEKLTG
jgi:hypothetical protein